MCVIIDRAETKKLYSVKWERVGETIGSLGDKERRENEERREREREKRE